VDGEKRKLFGRQKRQSAFGWMETSVSEATDVAQQRNEDGEPRSGSTDGSARALPDGEKRKLFGRQKRQSAFGWRSA